MVDRYVAELETALSLDRLSAYRPVGGDDLAMVSTYFWNVALCQSLYPSLGALEVAMRNGIHDALTQHFGRADWYDMPNLLLALEIGAIRRAKQEIRRARKPVTPGRVIAALNFGFWTSMLSAAYGNSPKGPRIWASPNSLLLAVAFPHAPPSIQPYRGRVHRHFDELRHLCNRVSHHEPVWAGMRLPSGNPEVPGRIVPLADLHARVVDAIGWINPTLRESVVLFDQFSDCYRHERERIESRLRDWLDTP